MTMEAATKKFIGFFESWTVQIRGGGEETLLSVGLIECRLNVRNFGFHVEGITVFNIRGSNSPLTKLVWHSQQRHSGDGK